MSLFLFRFWPALLPLVIYWLWLAVVRHKVARAGQPRPRFREGPWYWAVLASLLLGIFCFIALGAGTKNVKGAYVPPHMQEGRIVSGRMAP